MGMGNNIGAVREGGAGIFSGGFGEASCSKGGDYKMPTYITGGKKLPEVVAVEEAREKLAKLPTSTWDGRDQLIYEILSALVRAVEIMTED